MTHLKEWIIAGALLAWLPGFPPAPLAFGGAAPPDGVMLVQGNDAARREADRARRELQRQQRATECQNRVLAQQSRYASQVDFLRARQACGASR